MGPLWAHNGAYKNDSGNCQVGRVGQGWPIENDRRCEFEVTDQFIEKNWTKGSRMYFIQDLTFAFSIFRYFGVIFRFFGGNWF